VPLSLSLRRWMFCCGSPTPLQPLSAVIRAEPYCDRGLDIWCKFEPTRPSTFDHSALAQTAQVCHDPPRASFLLACWLKSAATPVMRQAPEAVRHLSHVGGTRSGTPVFTGLWQPSRGCPSSRRGCSHPCRWHTLAQAQGWGSGYLATWPLLRIQLTTWPQPMPGSSTPTAPG